MPKKKQTERQKAAAKGWQTRRKNERSAIAKRGWQTRRKKVKFKARKKKPNQEYIITVRTSGKTKRKQREWDLFVIGPANVRDKEIINWTIWYIRNHEETEDLEWISDLMEYPETKILVGKGKLVKKPRKVRLR